MNKVIVKDHINLIFFLFNLCHKLCFSVEDNRPYELYNNIGNDPLKMFEVIGEIYSYFKQKYKDLFSDCWKSFLEKELDIDKVNSLIHSAKEFISDYFNNDVNLNREIDDRTFGLVPFEPKEKINLIGSSDIKQVIENTLQVKKGNNEKISFFLISDNINDQVGYRPLKNLKFNKRKMECENITKRKRFKGITIEQKSHRIKNNKTKFHYNYDTLGIENHFEDFAMAIMGHKITENLKECKTFKISWKNNAVKIRPGSNFKKNFKNLIYGS